MSLNRTDLIRNHRSESNSLPRHQRQRSRLNKGYAQSWIWMILRLIWCCRCRFLSLAYKSKKKMRVKKVQWDCGEWLVRRMYLRGLGQGSIPAFSSLLTHSRWLRSSSGDFNWHVGRFNQPVRPWAYIHQLDFLFPLSRRGWDVLQSRRPPKGSRQKR